MGKTQAKKSEAREKRLGALPRSERLAKMATIKKKEGRVLDASEKHALKMTTEYGQIMRLWETLRTSTDPTADPQVVAARQKKRNDKREQRRQANSKQKKFTEEADDVSEDESDNEETAAPVAASGKAAGTTATAARTVERYEYKYPVIQELMQIITPQFASAVKTPRVSRVIQSIIKYGSPAHLDKLIALLATDFGTHCNDAFAHFVVCALIRHAPHHQYRKLLGMLVPIVPSIVSHKFGMQVMHAAYTSRLCSALDRNLLLLGVFKDSVAVMKHWRGYPVMEDIIAQELDHQKRLLQRLFDLSDKLVAQKDAFTLPYVQRLVYAFLRYGTKHEIVELSVTIKPHLAVLCDTREGATLASLAFSLLEPKARKDALRQFGERLSELVVGKYSAPVVARLFDLVYDAQLLHKYVAAGVEAEMIPILNSPYGYMILLHLLTPDDARRERVIFPAWKEHNLFSKGNASWNTHEWLDVQYKKETVELCSKPATRTHLSVLGPIVQKFIALIGDAAVLPTLNKTHVGLVARELLNSIENEAQYQSSVKLAPSDVALLKSVLPNKDQKREREATAPATEASTESVTKKSRTEASATPQRASSVKAPVSPPPRSTSKPSPVPKAPAEAPRSEKKVSGSVVRSLDRATSEVLDVNDDAPVERSARTPQRAATPTSAATPASAKKAPASAVKKSPRTPVSIARTSFKAQDATPSSASKKPKA